MKTSHACLFLLLCCCAACTRRSPLTATNLRCEYLHRPLGIDATHPRLSWELQSPANGERQQAYQIVCGADSLSVAQGKGSLWNTGRVASSRTAQVAYAGSPLTSRMSCWWKVRVWDQGGRASGWSPVAHWTMGLLHPSDWQAKWIGAPPEQIPLTDQYHDSHGYHSAIGSSPSADDWIRIDLGAPRKVDAVRLYPTRFHGKYGYLFPLHFSVSLSPDSGFRSAVTVVGQSAAYDPASGRPFVKKFPPVTARYLRLHVSGLAPIDSARYAWSLAEIGVMDGDSDLALHRPVQVSGTLTQQGWDASNWMPKRLTDGFLQANEKHTPYSLTPPPSPMLRKSFTVEKPVKSAVLYVTALGFYEAFLNGRRIGDHVLAPEWTDYHTRVQYQTYDVTDRMRQGPNALGALLADGWYAGAIFSHPDRGSYGLNRQLLAQLEITYQDGSRYVVATDGSWKIDTAGPVRTASIYNGETWDARFAVRGWDKAGFRDGSWSQATVYPGPGIILSAQMNEPVKVTDTIHPVAVFSRGRDTYIFDMGQNMVGWCRLSLPYNPHDTIRLRHGEVLNPDSTLYTANLRAARQTDTYIPAGGDSIVYTPKFTYHGFRYVEVTGLTRPPSLHAITGEVITSSVPQAGTFACSDPELNQLWRNILWTQRGNLISVPTDCPQRDERAGWMGDAQVFCQTAIFNMDMAAFYGKWVRDIRDCQAPDGRFGDFSPQVGNWMSFYNSPGWADAGVIVPWRAWENYADTTILRRQYPAMKKFIGFVHSENPDLIWHNARGNMYGDWLNGDAIVAAGYPKKGGAVPDDVYSTAFFAYSTGIVAHTAKLLGREQDYRHYDSLAAAIRKAFVSRFIDSSGAMAGIITGNTQAGYALALQFGLVPPALQQKAAAHMADALKAYDYRMSTGIQSTIRLMKQLSRFGYDSLAYTLLESHRFPSWLYSIDQGATTIWERWDGYVKGRGFQNPGMNSFNHVAFGSVGEWMYRNILGINPDDAHPGYSHFIIRPRPGGGLSWARGTYHSIRGMIGSSWKLDRNRFALQVQIPPNTTATVYVPAFGSDKTASGKGIKLLRREGGDAVYLVQSGKYTLKNF